MELYSSFGAVATFKGVGENFAAWVSKHSRPLVLDFDERTIKDVFQKQKSAVIIFNKENDDGLKATLSEASSTFEGDLLFVELTPENEHYERFAEFIKLDVNRARLIALKSSEQKKVVYDGEVTGITAADILNFAESLENGSANFIGLQDGESDEAPADEEEAPADGEEEVAEEEL